MTFKLFALTALCTTAIYGTAIANEPPTDNGISGYIGLGMIALPDYEGSEDFQAVPLLAARAQYENYYFETRGLGFRVNVLNSDRIEAGPVFNYNMGRDDDVENNTIASLREIDDAAELGAFVRVPYNDLFAPRDEFALDLSVTTDVSGTHDGTQFTFSPSYSYMFSPRFRLSTSVSTTYATDNYMETYFSVDADNVVRSGLTPFKATASFKDIGLGIMGNYQFDEKWGVIGLVRYTNLLGDASDSPIVNDEGDDNQFMLGTGVTYRF